MRSGAGWPRLSPATAYTLGYLLVALLWILIIDEWWEHRTGTAAPAQFDNILVWGLAVLSAAILYAGLRLGGAAAKEGDCEPSAPGSEDVPGLVLRADSSGRLRSWNTEAASRLGLDASWRGRPLSELAADAEALALRQTLQDAKANGEATAEVRLRTAEGVSRPFLFAVRPAEAGAQAGLLLTALDLGDVARGRRQLAARERQFRHMVEAVPQMVAVVVDEHIAYINPAGALLLGAQDASEVMGRSWPELHRRSSPDAPAMLRRLDGSTFEAEIQELPIFHDNAVATLVEARDITEASRALSALRESERRLDAVLDTVRDAVIIADQHGIIHGFNGMAERMFGLPRHEAVGRSAEALVPESRRTELQDFLARHNAEFGGAVGTVDLEGQNQEGRVFPLRLRLNAMRSGNRRLFVWVAHDMSAERDTALRLKIAEAVTEATSEGVMITDARGIVQWVNSAFCRISGYDREEVIGEDAALLKSGIRGGDGQAPLWSEVRARGEWSGEMWNRRKDGEVYPEWLTLKAVRDDNGDPVRLVAVFSDISRHKRAEETIKHLTYYDAVTRLPNRYLFHDRLSQTLDRANRSGTLVAAVMISLDRFRTINETLGHSVGDTLLRAISERLVEAVRGHDTVARLRGDTFCCILGDLHRSRDATPVVNRVLDAFAPSFMVGGHELFVTVRIGISVYPLDGVDLDDLINKAEKAMNRSKASGENSYQFYTPEMHADSVERLRLETDLRKAVKNDQLVLYYQPKICSETGKVLGAEALVRWQHPELGMVSPGRFIPIAEETGLIEAIGDWVLQETCRQIRAWQDAGTTVVPISVNFSANQFRRAGLVDMVAEVLRSWNVDASLLEAELTESAVMQNADVAVQRLEALHEAGVSLAIDDFGTGYSSLSYLRRFPLDRLKIDRSFVQDLGTSEAGEEIVSAIIAMAHSLNLRVVGEGVETVEQLEQLRRLKCDEIQGFLFSRPLPADEFEKILRTEAFDLPASATPSTTPSRRRSASAD